MHVVRRKMLFWGDVLPQGGFGVAWGSVGRARTPAISGFGVLDEVAFAGVWRFGRHVFGNDGEGLVVGSDLVAVGPVAAEDDAVGAVEFPERIELFAVVLLVANEDAIFNGGDFRELDVDDRVLREGSKIAAVSGDCVRVADHFGVGQVVDDDAEVGDSFCNLKDGADETRIGVCTFEDEAGIGQGTKAVEEVRFREVVKQIAIPQIAVADAEEERVFVKTVKLIAEGGVGGIQIADDAEDEWLGPGDIEQPFVVREKRAALDGDASGDSELPGKKLEAWRKSGFVESGTIGRWPGDTAGPGGIEEVNVRVDDFGHRIGVFDKRAHWSR